jgi:hypothetical protein
MFGTYWFWFEEKWGVNNGDLLYFYSTIVQHFLFCARLQFLEKQTRVFHSFFVSLFLQRRARAQPSTHNYLLALHVGHVRCTGEKEQQYNTTGGDTYRVHSGNTRLVLCSLPSPFYKSRRLLCVYVYSRGGGERRKKEQ